MEYLKQSYLLKIQYCLFWLLGLTCAASCLAIKIGASQIAIYNIPIVLIAVLCICFKNFYLDKNRLLFALLLLLMIFSNLFSILDVPDDWFNYGFSYSLKLIILIFPICFCLSNINISKMLEGFLRGIKVSCIIWLIWEVLQIIVFYNVGVSLNEFIFEYILGLESGRPSMLLLGENMDEATFRPTGLSWDPAYLGMILSFGYILWDNKYLKICFIIGAILSTSRTGFILMIIAIIMDFFYKHKYKLNSNISLRSLLCLLIVFITFIITIIIFYDNIINIISVQMQHISFDFFNGSKASNMSDNIHALYYINIFDIFFNSNNPIKFLLGQGYMEVGYFYALEYGLYGIVNPWNPESDFVILFIGCGVLGTSIYYFIMYKALKNKNSFCKSILILLLTGGIFYIFLRSTWTIILLLLIFLSKDVPLKKNNKKDI